MTGNKISFSPVVARMIHPQFNYSVVKLAAG
jgi:hypothetical protein